MSSNKVVWSQGLFLQPQHFQQQERFHEHLLESRVGSIAPHRYGFVSLSIDETVLALGKLAIAAATGVMPDGTPFSIPGEQPAPLPLDISPDMRGEVVYLALPMRRPGAVEADLEGPGEAPLTRYAVGDVEVPDNTAFDTTAVIQIGILQLRLMRATESTDAYTLLGVARISERRADAQVVIDTEYLPPFLSVSNSPQLSSLSREIVGVLHQRRESLAARLAQPGRGGVGEIIDFLYLQTINRFEPLCAHLERSPLLHPERLYSTLLALAEDLSSLGRDSRRPIEYPVYRHDDLEGTFRPLAADLRRLLGWEPEKRAIAIELQERRHGYRLAVIAESSLMRSADVVLAVSAQIPTKALLARFPAKAKVEPVEKIQELVTFNLRGVGLQPLPVAPRQIPFHAGYAYFQLDRGAPEMWGAIERGSALALHVPDKYPGLALELWAIRS